MIPVLVKFAKKIRTSYKKRIAFFISNLEIEFSKSFDRVNLIKKLAPDDSTIYSDEWKAYDDTVNVRYKETLPRKAMMFSLVVEYA
ncbi:MAG: hypothetical protein LBG04_03065 [Holosporaceae bacterium]|nr:hypothetical protein [Holosporaceae bacterium]